MVSGCFSSKIAGSMLLPSCEPSQKGCVFERPHWHHKTREPFAPSLTSFGFEPATRGACWSSRSLKMTAQIAAA